MQITEYNAITHNIINDQLSYSYNIQLECSMSIRTSDTMPDNSIPDTTKNVFSLVFCLF